MDTSPLVLAQSHALKATTAKTPAAAIDEHHQAAGQFAKAAKDTSNSEAFRTLKLLEQHHEKLYQIIKFQNTHPINPTPGTTSESKSSAPVNAAPSSSPTPPQDVSPHRPLSQNHAVAHRPQRDVGSSIASNLASARGIPSNRQRRSGQASSPILNQQNAEGKILSPPRRSRLASAASKTPRDTPTSEKAPQAFISDTPPIDVSSTPSKEATPTPAPFIKTEDAFNRFYNTFESLFSKLSAPLAFAGLPLNPDSDITAATNTAPSPIHKIPSKQPKPETRATASPEYSRLFSPAALRAIREEPGNTNLGAAESFYVVPTTGGMMPYASVLARHGNGDGHTTITRESTGLNEDIDEFVDARETPGPPSPIMARGRKGAVTVGGKTMEELQLENEGLRSLVDELSRRLWQFEISSQMSTAGLHQSIRVGMKQQTSTSHEVAAGADNKDADARLQMLEKEMAAMKRENEKLKGVVGRYRERWEKLKEGAKMRREGTDQGKGKEEGEL
ncbi:MAG: hypothetical protein Q9217_002883 [Psora testacea]